MKRWDTNKATTWLPWGLMLAIKKININQWGWGQSGTFWGSSSAGKVPTKCVQSSELDHQYHIKNELQKTEPSDCAGKNAKGITNSYGQHSLTVSQKIHYLT